MLLAALLAGCSLPLFVDDDRGHGIPAEAVRKYADAHRISRREAARELGLLQDANYLKELRTEPPQPTESPALEAQPAAQTSSSTTP